jgi:hypothetical protein
VSSIDPYKNARDVNRREKISRRFFIATRQRTEAFDVVKETFDLVTKPVKDAVFLSPIVLSSWVHRDHRSHSACMNLVDDAVSIITSVGDERLAGSVFNELLCFSRVVLLAGRQRDVERFSLGRRNRVELGRKTSSRAAQSIAFDPPFAPAASWCARITEPSTSEPTSSAIRSRLNIRSQTPRLAHREKRLCTFFHPPYRSGISRQGAPVFRRHMTAFTKLRSPRLDRGPRLVGKRYSIFAHWASLNSCRCIRIVAHARATSTNFWPLEIEDTP